MENIKLSKVTRKNNIMNDDGDDEPYIYILYINQDRYIYILSPNNYCNIM